MNTVELQVTLTESQAWELSQFLKRIGFSDYRQQAQSQKAAYEMMYAGEAIRSALAQAGVAPP